MQNLEDLSKEELIAHIQSMQGAPDQVSFDKGTQHNTNLGLATVTGFYDEEVNGEMVHKVRLSIQLWADDTGNLQEVEPFKCSMPLSLFQSQVQSWKPGKRFKRGC